MYLGNLYASVHLRSPAPKDSSFPPSPTISFYLEFQTRLSFLSANTPGPACSRSLDLKVNWPPQWPEMPPSLAVRFLKTLIPRAHTKKQTNNKKTDSSKSPNYIFLNFEKSLPTPVARGIFYFDLGFCKKHWEGGTKRWLYIQASPCIAPKLTLTLGHSAPQHLCVFVPIKS